MAVIAYKTKWFEPYSSQAGLLKPSLNLPNKKYQTGVYIIKSKSTGDIVYVGYSGSNLYKTIYRHFQTWNDRAQERRVYSKSAYLVRIVFTSPQRAAKLEKHLIDKLKPRDNNKEYKDFLTAQQHRDNSEFFKKAGALAPGEDPF